ncbi:hypothetical protein ACNO7W_16365, partial [Flavobacterium sp. ZB4R12]
VEPNKQKSAKVFPWVNRTISNAKKVLLGIHHNCVNQQYVSNLIKIMSYMFLEANYIVIEGLTL